MENEEQNEGYVRFPETWKTPQENFNVKIEHDFDDSRSSRKSKISQIIVNSADGVIAHSMESE